MTTKTLLLSLDVRGVKHDDGTIDIYFGDELIGHTFEELRVALLAALAVLAAAKLEAAKEEE